MNQHVNDFTETLQGYYNSMSSYKAMSREEEAALFEEYKAGSIKARDKIIKANLKFAFSIAKKYSGRGVPMEDLVSEANLGLIHAVEKFNPGMGFKFISYAVWWVRKYISDAIASSGKDMKDENVLDDDTETYKRGPLSDPEDDKVKVKETIQDSSLNSDDDEENKSFTVSLMEVLDHNERIAITRLYGMQGKEYTLREVSKEMGVSIERVRQIKKNAISKMRINALTSGSKFDKFFV